jgi:peroxiredoxin
MKPLRYPWIAAGILFAGATIWINYEVKVKLQGGAKNGSVRQLGEIKVGEPAPAFAAQDLASQTVRLGDDRGQKVTLIDFWATWCAPCKMALPGLQSVFDDFKARGVEVLSVDEGESAAQAGSYIKAKAYGFHVLLDPESAIGASYGVTGIPTLVVVDQAGIVRWIRIGYTPDDAPLRKVLEKLVRK